MAEDKNDLEARTRLPTEVETDSPFIVWGSFNMGLRQVLTIVISCFLWFVLLRVTTYIIPINGLFAGLLWSWMIIVGLLMTFIKKDDEPYEEYITGKIQFLLAERKFGIIDDTEDQEEIEDADWSDIDDY